MHVDGTLVPIALFVMGGATAILTPVARAFARRMDRQALQPPVTPEVTTRLERIEQAVDAIAIEVERISEGQRFTTRLLSERTGAPSNEGARPVAASTGGEGR